MRRPITFLLVLIAFAAVVAGGRGTQLPESSSAEQTRSATIAYAVDGDTLRVSIGANLVYVRLVGIDSPELGEPEAAECGSQAAAASMRSLAPNAAQVRLRLDSVAGHHDQYGRLLAHGFVSGRQLEIAQLRRGWATVYRFNGQRFDGLARFERAESAARARHAGVWGACGGDFHSTP